MPDLQGRSIVVLEGRKPSEVAGLIARHGGRPINAPALREVIGAAGQDVADFIDLVDAGNVEAVIFLTGVGASALIEAAAAAAKKDEYLRGLRGVKVVCRGPKPAAVMRAHDVPIAFMPPEPYTSEVLVEGLRAQGWELRGKIVALQHYGEVNAELRSALETMGAEVIEASPYEWALPEDTAPLEAAIRSMAAGEPDAVAFTTQAQVRHLFELADPSGSQGRAARRTRRKGRRRGHGPGLRPRPGQ